MAVEQAATAAIGGTSAEARKTFAVCFAALVATSFCFILRASSLGAWGDEFGLSETQKGELFGVGLWPFAISIVLLSLIIDKIGFKATLWFAAVCHIAGLAMTLMADGYWSLYWSGFVLSLGNGAVEAGINPLVAREFRHDKTTWLNRLHAGWPAGFVIGGILFLALPTDMGWRYKMALMAIPVIVYVFMLLPRRFPQSERVAAGVSYREMLGEAGFLSAFVVAILMVLEVGTVIAKQMGLDPADSTVRMWEYIAIGVITVGYGLWSRSPGKPLFIVMILVMIPLAVTELGTDGWITGMMESSMKELGLSGTWVLIYTMALVLVLRLFAGPLVHKLSPLGLLAASAALAAVGLVLLSTFTGVMLLVAATIYGIGKAFFWPTSLGVVAEQSPKGGAITLNVVAGVGMLAAGIVGSPVIGGVQDAAMVKHVAEYDAKNGTQLSAALTIEKEGMFGKYSSIDPGKRAAVSDADAAVVDKIASESKLQALRTIAILPVIMLVVYLGLIFYFRKKGGYKPVVLDIKH